MEGLQVHVVEDVHEGVGIGNEANPTTGLDSMLDMEGETPGGVSGVQDREIWLEGEQEDLLDVNDASIFYAEFPPLLDFSCMSSSSSSSSTPAPVKTFPSSSVSSSSSSGAPWAAMKSDADEDAERSQNDHNYHYRLHRNYDQYDPLDASTAALSSTASMEIPRPPPDQLIDPDDCMDIVEAFSYTELLENNDFFDPSSIFQFDDEKLVEDSQQKSSQQGQQQQQPHPQQGNEGWTMSPTNDDEDSQQGERGGKGAASDDIAMVFIEWLKSNKETVSAEELRKVKIKKATIECAARRLGGGKEAMKQLLKLILEWVQTNHLQKRGSRASSSNLPCQYRDSHQNPSPNPILNPNLNCASSIRLGQSNHCFTQYPWIPPPAAPHVADWGTLVPGFPPMVGYIDDLSTNGASNMKGHPYAPQADYHMLESASSWPRSQVALPSRYTSFIDNNLHTTAPLHPSPTFTGYGNQYPYQYGPGQSERLGRPGTSATKEARKKRMARQRRFLSHNRNQSHHNNQQQQNQVAYQHASLGIGNENGDPPTQANPENWVYWPKTTSVPASAVPPVLPVDARPPPSADRPSMHLQAQNCQRQLGSERRQGWKPEKNLMFLLQKVLKQSDVGNLGRIVLPKKEAETNLPELDARDGISLAMEDIGTSRVWNMRYRFWPNNKSRMYLLENTGDFVRTNGLQEGDFIVIYSDVTCGKYLIRGVKVRQPGAKAENKRLGKSQRNGPSSSASTADGSSSKPVPQIQAQPQAQPQTQSKGNRSNPPVQ